MTKLEAIAAAKQFRKDADELLQRMKEHKSALLDSTPYGGKTPVAIESIDFSEVIAQHVLSIRDLESCMMRQTLVLQSIGE